MAMAQQQGPDPRLLDNGSHSVRFRLLVSVLTLTQFVKAWGWHGIWPEQIAAVSYVFSAVLSEGLLSVMPKFEGGTTPEDPDFSAAFRDSAAQLASRQTLYQPCGQAIRLLHICFISIFCAPHASPNQVVTKFSLYHLGPDGLYKRSKFIFSSSPITLTAVYAGR